MRALKFDDTGLFLLAGPVLSVVYQMSKLAKISKYAEGVQSEWPFGGHSHIYSLAFLGFLFFFPIPLDFAYDFCVAQLRYEERKHSCFGGWTLANGLGQYAALQ